MSICKQSALIRVGGERGGIGRRGSHQKAWVEKMLE